VSHPLLKLPSFNTTSQQVFNLEPPPKWSLFLEAEVVETGASPDEVAGETTAQGAAANVRILGGWLLEDEMIMRLEHHFFLESSDDRRCLDGDSGVLWNQKLQRIPDSFAREGAVR